MTSTTTPPWVPPGSNGSPPWSARATAPGRDLRSSDARVPADAPGGTVTRVNPPATVVQTRADGFHWDDAAISAAGMLGLVLVVAGGTAAITRRHRTRGRLATS